MPDNMPARKIANTVIPGSDEGKFYYSDKFTRLGPCGLYLEMCDIVWLERTGATYIRLQEALWDLITRIDAVR